MGKVLHKVFNAAVNAISQPLLISNEHGSEVSYFITESRNFVEVTIISKDIKTF